MPNLMPKTSRKTTRPSDRYAAMTKAEYDAEAAQFEPPNEVTGTPLTPAEWTTMKHAARNERARRGRPAKPTGEKYARIILTLPPKLLTATDAAAKKAGTTRAALIADALRTKLKYHLEA